MIRIQRGPEATACPELAVARDAELARVRPAARADYDGNWEELLGKRYRVARTALAKLQHYKCCYCEAKQNSERWHHTEHIRPKSRYWWLTWTWDNLLFSCHDCNHAKSDEYPLVDEQARLQPEAAPPGHESPMLIDPSGEDPREHIRFRPLTPIGPWLPMPLDERGERTLLELGWVDDDEFVQPGLLQKWQEHVEDMQPMLTALRASFRSVNAGKIRRDWDELTSRRRRASQPFVALSLDVLEHYFADEIERFTLPMTVIP